MTKLIAYNRKNKDYDMWLNDRYVGSRATYRDAERALDEMAYDELTHGLIAA